MFSGYPAADRTGWDEFRAEYGRAMADLHGEFSAFCAERGAGELPETEFIHESDWLNLYLYPAEVDYARGDAARADVASARHLRQARGREGELPAPSRPATARSSTCRSAASARPTSTS